MDISRRDFLKGAATVGVSATIAGCSGSSPKNNSTDKRGENYSKIREWIGKDFEVVDKTNSLRVTINVGNSGNESQIIPRVIRIQQDTRLTWNFRGDDVHNIVSKNRPVPNSGSGQIDGKYSVYINQSGVNLYKCQFHDEKGALIVNEEQN